MRELASRKLDYFTKYTKEDYEMIATQWGKPIHRQIIEKLEAVERWDIKRLMIFVRPRIWKSELASIRFPIWCLGKNPARKIVITSYGADLASDFWRKAKQVVEDTAFKNVFPEFALSKDKKEWGNWETSKGWWIYTTWINWVLTWKWFDIGIIDDPVKDRKEAESPVVQQDAIDWYTSTFNTRKQSEKSAIIVMMTRWNVNDLAGYLLKEQENWWDQWDVLVIPAVDEEWNEIIWPWKWSEWHILHEKNTMSKKDWAALYQQDPIWASSNIFNLNDLRYYLQSDFEKADWILKKEDLYVWIFVDPAFSSSKNSDDAVIFAMWRHKITWNFYQLDWYADTSAPSKTFIAIMSMYDRLHLEWYKVEFISIESVTLNRDQTKFINDFKLFMKENWRYAIVNIFKPEQKKEDRIKFVLEPVISMNSLFIRKDMSDKWFIRKLEDQIYQFPNSRHDDVIDCLAQAVEVLLAKRTLWLRQPNLLQAPREFFNRMTGRYEKIKQ
jgi:hypothetical protein